MILVACYLIYLSSDSSQNLKEQVKIIFTPPCHPLILPFFTSLSFSLSDGHGSDSRTSLVRLPNPLFLWELGDLLVKVPSAYSNLKVIVWFCAATYVVSSVQIIQDPFFEALTPKDTISIWQQFLIHMFTEVRLPLWRTGGNQICHLKCQQLLHRRKKKKKGWEVKPVICTSIITLARPLKTGTRKGLGIFQEWCQISSNLYLLKSRSQQEHKTLLIHVP